MVRVADQSRKQYVTFPRGRGKKKPPKPKSPRSKRSKGEKMYMQSLTPAGKQAYGKLPPNVQARLKGATVGESAKILRAYREVEQGARKRRSRK